MNGVDGSEWAWQALKSFVRSRKFEELVNGGLDELEQGLLEEERRSPWRAPHQRC